MTETEAYKLYMKNAAADLLRIAINGNPPDESLMREIEIDSGVPVEIAKDFRKSTLASYHSTEILNIAPANPGDQWWDNLFFKQAIKNYAQKH